LGRTPSFDWSTAVRDESVEHYQTGTYWYGAPAPALIKTDELNVGDAESEKKHQYLSPQASEPYEITSRYEWAWIRFQWVREKPTNDSLSGRIPIMDARTTGSFAIRIEAGPEEFGPVAQAQARTMRSQISGRKFLLPKPAKSRASPIGSLREYGTWQGQHVHLLESKGRARRCPAYCPDVEPAVPG